MGDRGTRTCVWPWKRVTVHTEARFALGSRAGPRSTIWKAWVAGNEAYIASRMFGSDMKVSFHSSGRCQWSATDTWVRRQGIVRNAERHVYRWQVTYPTGNEALLLFRVEIPETELRLLPAPTDHKKVWWVSGQPLGATVRFLFYMTRPTDAEPQPAPSEQRRHLFSLRLRDTRCLVCIVDLISLSATDLEAARSAAIAQAAAAGFVPGSQHRLSLFIQPPPEGGAQGLLELCATA